MRSIKSRDTGPEVRVRRLVHALGFRYRLYLRELPGKPDLVFRPKRRVIFVHGCFWHGHHCSRGSRLPQTNAVYWRAKIERNRERDAAVIDSLERDGWSALILWECELKDLPGLTDRICRFLT